MQPSFAQSVNVDHSYARPKIWITTLLSDEHPYALPPIVSVATNESSDIKPPPESPSISIAPVEFCPSPSATVLESSKSPSPSLTEQATSASPTAFSVECKTSHVNCPHCSIVLRKKNLFLHIHRKHGGPKDITAAYHLQSVLVDKTRGLYAVRKTSRGFSVPVHVQRKAWGPQHVLKCELEECMQYHLDVVRRGLSHSMCDHIRSIDYCNATAAEEQLQHKVLEEMLEQNVFDESVVAVCKKRQNEAKEAHVPFSVLVDLGSSQNKICLSVNEPNLDYYSSLARVIVTYNIERNSWHCPCAKACTSCPHKNIAMWHLFQTHREHLMTAALSPVATPTNSHLHTAEMERSVRYIYENKKIPAALPQTVTALRALTDYPRQLIPAETECKVCPGSPELEEAVQITNNATLVGMDGVISNITTYNRRCTECRMLYRYQEWTDGLHNFNDRVILTLQLCLYLRDNLQNHVSVAQVINSLESLFKKTFRSPDPILEGYCQFEALCETRYKYSCIKCGLYSPVVTDHHRQEGFTFELSEPQQPNDECNGEDDGEESVHLHLISRGFFEDSSQIPFIVHPDSDTRNGREFEKEQPYPGQPELADLTKEHLVNKLLNQKVATILKLCKSCYVDTEETRCDLINQMNEEMKSRRAYDEVIK